MFRIAVPLICVAAVSASACAADSVEAAKTRSQRLQLKVTIDWADKDLRDALTELGNKLDEAKLGQVDVQFAPSVGKDLKVSFSGANQTIAEVLDVALAKLGLGYIIVSAAGEKSDGGLLIRPGRERGTPANQPNPKTEEENEKLAAAKLALIERLIEDKKFDRASERIDELIEQYPKTKAAAKARVLKEKLK